MFTHEEEFTVYGQSEYIKKDGSKGYLITLLGEDNRTFDLLSTAPFVLEKMKKYLITIVVKVGRYTSVKISNVQAI